MMSMFAEFKAKKAKEWSWQQAKVINNRQWKIRWYSASKIRQTNQTSARKEYKLYTKQRKIRLHSEGRAFRGPHLRSRGGEEQVQNLQQPAQKKGCHVKANSTGISSSTHTLSPIRSLKLDAVIMHEHEYDNEAIGGGQRKKINVKSFSTPPKSPMCTIKYLRLL